MLVICHPLGDIFHHSFKNIWTTIFLIQIVNHFLLTRLAIHRIINIDLHEFSNDIFNSKELSPRYETIKSNILDCMSSYFMIF